MLSSTKLQRRPTQNYDFRLFDDLWLEDPGRHLSADELSGLNDLLPFIRELDSKTYQC